jgi:hypothetical protein
MQRSGKATYKAKPRWGAASELGSERVSIAGDGSQDSWREHEAVRAINESDEGGMSGPGDERVSIGIPGMD